jgi:hypothetical protein
MAKRPEPKFGYRPKSCPNCAGYNIYSYARKISACRDCGAMFGNPDYIVKDLLVEDLDLLGAKSPDFPYPIGPLPEQDAKVIKMYEDMTADYYEVSESLESLAVAWWCNGYSVSLPALITVEQYWDATGLPSPSEGLSNPPTCQDEPNQPAS